MFLLPLSIWQQDFKYNACFNSILCQQVGYICSSEWLILDIEIFVAIAMGMRVCVCVLVCTWLHCFNKLLCFYQQEPFWAFVISYVINAIKWRSSYLPTDYCTSSMFHILFLLLTILAVWFNLHQCIFLIWFLNVGCIVIRVNLLHQRIRMELIVGVQIKSQGRMLFNLKPCKFHHVTHAIM